VLRQNIHNVAEADNIKTNKVSYIKNLVAAQLAKILHAFYGTLKFIGMFTRTGDRSYPVKIHTPFL
jgi:hypothetical protein